MVLPPELDPTQVVGSRRPGSRTIAAAAVMAWIIGAAVASSQGLWSGMGTTAVVAGGAVLAAQWRVPAPSLVPRASHILIGVAAGLAMVVATHVLYRPLSTLAPFLRLGTAQLYLQVGGRDRLLFGVLLLPIAAAEELVWRGSVQSALTSRLGSPGAVAIGAVLYALSHAPVGAAVLVLTALGCGAVWGALRAATGSLIACMVAHVLWDELLLFVAPLTAMN